MPDQPKDVSVPQDVEPNLTFRDLRPYYRDNEKELVQDELIGPQQYQMGVVPKHISRAGKSAAGAGTVGAAVGLPASDVGLSALMAGTRTLTAPIRPDRVVTQAQTAQNALGDVGTTVSEGEEAPKEEEDGQGFLNAVKQIGSVYGKLKDTVAPYAHAYREYNYAPAQAAETAAKRLAKARRKKKRRESDGMSLRERFVQPIRDNRAISRRIKKQMGKGGPIQLNVPSGNDSN